MVKTTVTEPDRHQRNQAKYVKVPCAPDNNHSSSPSSLAPGPGETMSKGEHKLGNFVGMGQGGTKSFWSAFDQKIQGIYTSFGET